MRSFARDLVLAPGMALFLCLGIGKAEVGDQPTDTNDISGTNSVNPSSITSPASVGSAAVSSLSLSDLMETPSLSAPVKQLLTRSLALTRQNLSYVYGSDDPASGGMDCSGAIHYLLQQSGIGDAPRDSSDLYEWAWKNGRFEAVVSSNPNTFELSRLRPGDLLFWTGTYRINRDPPVTHVMIYLGTSRLTGRRVMVGSSDGRTFNDKPRYGVSVFDFKLPNPAAHRESSGEGSRFIGYSPIPGLGKASLGREESPSGSSPR